MELQTENKELKAKLYDCMTTVTSHEKELGTAKSSLQELLLAFTELSERYEEKSRELDSVRDELEKCLGTSGTFVVKQTAESEDDGDEPLYYQEVRERAQKAIEQIERATASVTSKSSSLAKLNGAPSMLETNRIGRVKQSLPPVISANNGHSVLSRTNMAPSLPNFFRVY